MLNGDAYTLPFDGWTFVGVSKASGVEDGKPGGGGPEVCVADWGMGNCRTRIFFLGVGGGQMQPGFGVMMDE